MEHPLDFMPACHVSDEYRYAVKLGWKVKYRGVLDRYGLLMFEMTFLLP